MYEISSESAKTLTDNSTAIKLPRFQRKQTWNDKKNFELCISIFKNYPIGMFVLNEEISRTPTGPSNTSWLLDGRQRRNALLKLYENPENIYLWAMKFIKFKKTDSEDQIEEKFYISIANHLESDQLDDDSDESDTNYQPELYDVDDFNEPNIGLDGVSLENPNYKYYEPNNGYSSNLDLLLEIIKMCHKYEKNYSGYSKVFDLSPYFLKVDYIETDSSGTKKINGSDLTAFINSYIRQVDNDMLDEPECEHFIRFVRKRYVANTEVQQESLDKYINTNWKRIKHRILLVKQLGRQLHLTKVGLIKLTDCTSSDAQNIFKLINSSGTSLTPVEILSAKPSWNKLITNPSNGLEVAVSKLYNTLEIKQEGIVRWDYPATLMDRLSNFDFIFPYFDYTKDSQFKSKVTLGFKILSAIYEGGITKEKYSNLSKSKKVNWNELDKVLGNLNTIGKLLSQTPYFKYLTDWKTTLYDLTSEAICINFIVLVYKNWISKGSPIGTSSNATRFINESNSLFDKMIYEYTLKQWKGSSDSRIAENISKFNNENTFKSITQERWEDLIEELVNEGTIQGELASQNDVKAILYYYYMLNGIKAPNTEESFQVDHIISKLHFNTSTGIEQDMRDNICNLCILESSMNNLKKEISLARIDALADSDIAYKRLRDSILDFTGLKIDDLTKVETAADFKILLELRGKSFIDAFTKKRNLFIN